MTNPVGRPKSDVETVVIAVRISMALRDRLARHVDLTTRQGRGAKASINSVVGYAIECLLDAEEKPQQKSVKVRQEPQRPSTPAHDTSAALRQKVEGMNANRKRLVTLLQDHPEGLSPAQTKKLLGVEKDLGDAMERMTRDGILSRIEKGRYVVAEDVLELLEKMEG